MTVAETIVSTSAFESTDAWEVTNGSVRAATSVATTATME